MKPDVNFPFGRSLFLVNYILNATKRNDSPLKMP